MAEHSDEYVACSCGHPERLPDGPYQGIALGEVGGMTLYRLTDHERIHAGRDLYCLRGFTHWWTADFFVQMAENHRQDAARLDAAAALLADHFGSSQP